MLKGKLLISSFQRKEIQDAVKSGVSIYSRQDAQYILILITTKYLVRYCIFCYLFINNGNW